MTTTEEIAASSYTPAELSYLLAGRQTPEAARARQVLGLAEIFEGDPSILPSVQSLRARGLVTIGGEDDDTVELAQSTQAMGYVLGTANDWTRLAVATPDRVEALVVASAPGVPSALVLRADRVGNYQAVATKPETHPSQIVGMVVSGYLAQVDQVTVSIHRDKGDDARVLVAEASVSADQFTVTRRSGLTGADDVADGETVVVDKATYLSNLETLLGE